MDKIKKYIEEHFFIVSILLLICFSILFSSQDVTAPWGSKVNYSDSAVYQYMGRLIIEGKMPYRDAFDHNGPILYLMNALSDFIFGINGPWILDLVCMFVLLLFGYKTVRLVLERQEALFITISILSGICWGFWIGNTPDFIASAFIMVILYVVASGYKVREVTGFQGMVLGVLAACVFWTKYATLSGILILFIYLWIYLFKKGNISKVIGAVFFFLVGFTLVTSVLLIWLKQNHALYYMVEYYFKFKMQRFVDDVVKSDVGRVFFFFVNRVDIILLIYASIIYGVTKYFSKSDDEISPKIFGITLLVLMVQIIISSLSGRSFVQYSCIYYPFILLAFALIFEHFKKLPKISGTRVQLLIIVMILFIPNLVVMRKNQLANWSDLEGSKAIVTVIKENSGEDDYIAVASPDHAGLYNETGRKSATKYFYIHPLMFEDGDGIWDDYERQIRENHVKIVVWFDTQDINAFLPRIAAEYQKKYSGNGVSVYVGL